MSSLNGHFSASSGKAEDGEQDHQDGGVGWQKKRQLNWRRPVAIALVELSREIRVDLLHGTLFLLCA